MLCSSGPGTETFFINHTGLLCFINRISQRPVTKPDWTSYLQDGRQSGLRVTTFLALIYLCVSIPTPESWRTLAWSISVFVSKVPGVWQRCFAAVLWEIHALRDMQWSTPQSGLWLDHRKAPAQMKPGGIKSYLCSITVLRSPPEAGICTLQGTIHAVCKGVWKTAHAPAALGHLHPFLEPDDLSVS